MQLPFPRGPVSAALIDALSGDSPDAVPHAPLDSPADVLADEDAQLALWVCYELHYRGFEGVPDRWEWEPAVIGLRRDLEDLLLAQLRRDVVVTPDRRRVADRLRALVDADDGPSLSRFLQTEADRAQFLQFLQLRSLYQLKEADPHTWAVPRLSGKAKAALVEIQTDEYGNGDVQQMHSELFRTTLLELGLDARYGAYLNEATAITLALSNVMSLFGLRRELRGALVGHLAAYEMTSSAPCRRYAKGLRRVGGSAAACAFFDVHVNADALHEQVAAHDLCGGLAESEPALTEDIVFGAAACLHVDARFATTVLDSWSRGGSAVRDDTAEFAGAR